MTTAVVIGSCLANLPCIWLMSEYKWQRPNNAAVLRSDFFVSHFLDGEGELPSQDQFLKRVRWQPDMADEGLRWLRECYRDQVGHLEVPLDQPGLFETLATRKVDVVLMDNLHDTYHVLTHYRAPPGEATYALPFSLSRCANEQELLEYYWYDAPLSGEASAHYWSRIVRFVQQLQPWAKIIFFAAHACTSQDLPDRRERTLAFHAAFRPAAAELGIDLIAPFDLPPQLTGTPPDRDHFEMSVYRAMAGYIYLKTVTGGAV